MTQAFEARSNDVVSALHARELSQLPDPLGLLATLRGQGYPWLLDSAMQDARLGRFSFVGADLLTELLVLALLDSVGAEALSFSCSSALAISSRL